MKIAILVENYFEDEELLYPYYVLKEAGPQTICEPAPAS